MQKLIIERYNQANRGCSNEGTNLPSTTSKVKEEKTQANLLDL